MSDYFPSNKTNLIPLLSFSTVLGIFHSSHQSDDCPFTFLLTYVKCYEVLSFVHPQIYKLCSISFSFWQQNHWKMLHLFSILIQKPPSLLSFLRCPHTTLLIHTNGWLWQAFKQPAWENSNSLPWPEEQKQAAVEKVIMKQKLQKQPHHLTPARLTFSPLSTVAHLTQHKLYYLHVWTSISWVQPPISWEVVWHLIPHSLIIGRIATVWFFSIHF